LLKNGKGKRQPASRPNPNSKSTKKVQDENEFTVPTGKFFSDESQEEKKALVDSNIKKTVVQVLDPKVWMSKAGHLPVIKEEDLEETQEKIRQPSFIGSIKVKEEEGFERVSIFNR
jgi:hypothetical protein